MFGGGDIFLTAGANVTAIEPVVPKSHLIWALKSFQSLNTYLSSVQSNNVTVPWGRLSCILKSVDVNAFIFPLSGAQ